MSEHKMRVQFDSSIGEIRLYCEECFSDIVCTSDFIDDLSKAARNHIRHEEQRAMVEAMRVRRFQAIEPKQSVIDFTDPAGQFLITNQKLLEIPMDNFEEFKAILDAEVIERQLDVDILDDPNGILIKWKPKV